jgi:hypothetical protein
MSHVRVDRNMTWALTDNSTLTAAEMRFLRSTEGKNVNKKTKGKVILVTG